MSTTYNATFASAFGFLRQPAGSLAALAIFAWLGLGSARAALLTNGGFETGDLSGWTVSDTSLISVVSQFTAPFSGVTASPYYGQSFAVLAGGGISDTIMSQTVILSAGDMIEQVVRFINDNLFGPNSAYVRVVEGDTGNPTNTFQLYSQDGNGVGGYGGSDPWTTIDFIAPVTDSYTFQFQLSNGSPGFSSPTSYLLVDMPEPASMAVLAFGLAGLGILRRRTV